MVPQAYPDFLDTVVYLDTVAFLVFLATVALQVTVDLVSLATVDFLVFQDMQVLPATVVNLVIAVSQVELALQDIQDILEQSASLVFLVIADLVFQAIVAFRVSLVTVDTLVLYTLVQHHPHHPAQAQCGGMMYMAN